MQQTSGISSRRKRLVMLGLAVIFIAVIVFVFIDRKHTAAKATAKLSGYCIGQDFSSSSSGHCVRDLQTLIDYMENSGLTECPFVGKAALTINGTYDSATTTQVKSIQAWADCYAKQEGFTSNVQQTGTVDRATWGELCIYGYTDPVHSAATGASASIAAGEDAGCMQLRAS